MEYSLNNGKISISIIEKGAELRSLKKIDIDEEYMWEADPKYWGKKSPVLFPFVGEINNGKYTYKGKEYKMTKHGFSRDCKFEMIEKSDKTITFLLESNEETKKMYPFDFEFYIKYILTNDGVDIQYKVINKTAGEMYFSIGGHPAFSTPTNENIRYEDYYLEFNKNENQKIYMLDGAFVGEEKKDFLNNENKILLKKNIFDNDALIFENLTSNIVTLKNTKNTRQLELDFTGFPYLAFWAVPGASYVCIEPWYGIADFVKANNKIEEKKGMQRLGKDEKFESKIEIKIS